MSLYLIDHSRLGLLKILLHRNAITAYVPKRMNVHLSFFVTLLITALFYWRQQFPLGVITFKTDLCQHWRLRFYLKLNDFSFIKWTSWLHCKPILHNEWCLDADCYSPSHPNSAQNRAASHAASLITLILALIPRTLPRTIPTSRLTPHILPSQWL